MKLLEQIKLRAKDPVINEDAFWDFFSKELRHRSGVSRTPAQCAKMVIIYVVTCTIGTLCVMHLADLN